MATTQQRILLLLLLPLILLSLLPLVPALPSTSIPRAAAVLSNSGYVAMALTLEFGSQTNVLPPKSTPTLTIFTPPDAAFAHSGQPPLSLLHFHFTPVPFSLHSLKSLPPGTKIPTFFPNHTLTVTSSPAADGSGLEVSLNGVRIVNGSTMYDDGSLVVIAVDEFFDPNFVFSGEAGHGGPPHSTLGCPSMESGGGGEFSFEEANGVLRSRGYSVTASFLDVQLAEFKNQTMLTIFAPSDDVMKGFIGDFGNYGSVFLRHVVPCKISLSYLANLDTGVLLPTYLKGFTIDVTESGDGSLMANGVRVLASDLYSNSWLAVHGLNGSLVVVQDRPQESSPSAAGRIGSGSGNYQDGAGELKVKNILVAALVLVQLFLIEALMCDSRDPFP